MQIIRNSVMLSVCFLATAIAAAAITSQGEMSHRINVILVARESSLHTSIGNRDVYLLRVTPRKGPEFDAIGVDSYPAYEEALSLHGLNNATFSVKLTRTPYCDQPAKDNVQGTLIHCFAIEHNSWKAPKSVVNDLWWK